MYKKHKKFRKYRKYTQKQYTRNTQRGVPGRVPKRKGSRILFIFGNYWNLIGLRNKPEQQ